jgi:hypothetical protein
VSNVSAIATSPARLGEGTAAAVGGGGGGVTATVVLPLPLLFGVGEVLEPLVPHPAAKATLKIRPTRDARRKGDFNNEFPTLELTQSH